MADGGDVLFVIGAPRSGTKLLRGILNNHGSVMLAGEFDSHARLLERWAERDPHSDFDRFLRDLSRTRYWMNLERDGTRFPAGELEELSRGMGSAGALLVFLRIAAAMETGKPPSTRITGQKSPHMINRLETLDRHYPDARYVHIVRDVRNCALSSKRVWGTDLFRYSQRWYDSVSAAEEFLGKTCGDRALTVRFEDLTSDPSTAVRGICGFLGLEYDDGLVRLSEPTEHHGDAKELRGVMAQDGGKFREHLSPDQVERIESITWPMLDRFGYPFDYRGSLRRTGRVRMRWLQFLDVAHRLAFDMREQGPGRILHVLRTKMTHFRK